jgi:uncharacterized protein with NRDE domain
MCLVALLFRVVEDAPLIVGANREEAYARGGEAPRLLPGPCRVVAGLDPQVGGTWLGINEHEVIVAVTNRRRSEVPAQPRSRGVLVRELLGCTSAAAAAEMAARELERHPYAGCNMICADRTQVSIVQAGDWLRVRLLPPGIHVLTNGDLNDGSDPRLGHAHWWLSERSYANADDCVAALAALCGQSGGDSPPICLHGKDRGTVTSSIIALRIPRGRSTYLHAQGPPDQTPYVDLSHLLRELEPAPDPGR